jgi:hypothetical protein
MTKGEYRVGINFNPSNDDRVAKISRLKALAQTDIESAAMWAVKAATKPSMEN